jgi:hypothetical protein
MHLDQLETLLVGTSSLERLTSIVQADRPNIAHQGTTGGNTIVDVKRSDLATCPAIPLAEKRTGCKNGGLGFCLLNFLELMILFKVLV